MSNKLLTAKAKLYLLLMFSTAIDVVIYSAHLWRHIYNAPTLVTGSTAAIAFVLFAYLSILSLCILLMTLTKSSVSTMQRFINAAPVFLRPVIATTLLGIITLAPTNALASSYIPPTLTRISPHQSATTTTYAVPATTVTTTIARNVSQSLTLVSRESATWTVKHGECLWSIAEAILRQTNAHPDNHDVARLTQQLIDANRNTFRSPNNPDLIYAGQVLEIPTN